MKLEALPLLHAEPIPTQRRWRKSAIALALVVLAGGGWAVLHAVNPAQAAASAPKAPPVLELSQGDVATVVTNELRVSLPLSGYL